MAPAVTQAVERLDAWMRSDFVEMNTELDEAYYAAGADLLDEPGLDPVKQALLHEGAERCGALASAPLPADGEERYELLGMVGCVLAALRRHETEDDAVLEPTWTVAGRLGASLGVAPRYVFAHQTLVNTAVGDHYRTFTSLQDERLFVTANGLAVLAYQRTADALRRVGPMGVSHPMAAYLLETARDGLEDVLRFNRGLAEELDATRFFLNVRPYFKPYRVAGVQYRGANAGDVAAINEIDVLLGLCRTTDPFYRGVLAEKHPYVPPADQAALRALERARPLLDLFLAEAERGVTPELRRNAALFADVCRAHSAAYAFHHHRLVKTFLQEPARTAPPARLASLTASGPPLEVVVGMLERLRFLRSAQDRPGLVTARADLDRLAALTAG